MKSVIGHGHRFGKALCLVINAARSNRIHVTPVILFLGMDQRVSIALTGRGQKEGGPFCLGQAERVMGSQRAYFERLNR